MIFTAIIYILLGLIRIIMLPIDFIINQFIPNFSQLTTNIISFFETVTTYLGWAINAIPLNSIALALIVAFWTFKLSAPVIAWLLKLTFKWWRAVKG